LVPHELFVDWFGRKRDLDLQVKALGAGVLGQLPGKLKDALEKIHAGIVFAGKRALLHPLASF
jgi:hypothetical protein